MITALAEKRKHSRIDKTILLRVATQQETDAPEWTIVTTKNISAGGVLFSYNRQLQRGTPLYLKMHFPDRAIDCNATVRRATPGVVQPLIHVAATLRGLDQSERDYIQHYVA